MKFNLKTDYNEDDTISRQLNNHDTYELNINPYYLMNINNEQALNITSSCETACSPSFGARESMMLTRPISPQKAEISPK